MHSGHIGLAQAAARKPPRKARTFIPQYLVVKNLDLNLVVRQVGGGVCMCVCVCVCERERERERTEISQQRGIDQL